MTMVIGAAGLDAVRAAHPGVGFMTGCVRREDSDDEYGVDGMTMTCVTEDQVAVVMFDIAQRLAASDGDGDDPGAIRDHLVALAEGQRRRIWRDGQVWVGWPNLRLTRP
ncbi:hypothetical protein [Nocardia terpenica]|uniref:Uncharacterized protein n=1 Tax=Nocardia terpenica TaxID=455432 RepID=A0A291RC41_9NOCA|nr:hypothetical protein [Nocardia terpenica]ATL65101.1 hypothetical protein CRH09_01515 [Nocardia terpenica]